MEILLVYGSWFVFTLLISYTVISGINEDWVENTDIYRKSWYLIFLFGCLLYITYEPSSLFNDWKNYLIALVAFIVIDSLLFLNLYFTKLSGNELKATKRQIDKTQYYLSLTKQKIYNMEKVLNSYEYPGYTSSKEMYIQELDDFFNLYANKEKLYVDVLPYDKETDRNEVLEGRLKAKIKRKLALNQTYYSSKDEYMLVPLAVGEESYIIYVCVFKHDTVIN